MRNLFHQLFFTTCKLGCWVQPFKLIPKKTSHKLHDIKMHGAPALATIFLVDKEDLTTFHFYDSTVLDGNFENIKRRTFDTLLAAADRLAVHVPGEIPDFRGIEAKRLAFFISSRNLDMNIVDMALIGR